MNISSGNSEHTKFVVEKGVVSELLLLISLPNDDLSDGTNEKIQAVIDAGVYNRLVEFLMYESGRLRTLLSVLLPTW
jgi:hypothetical protein